MDGSLLLSALALVLILEGLLPFIAPGVWRNTMAELVKMEDAKLRLVGLISLSVGLLLLWVFA
ncbi:DUF2065 domain-containing protein [Thiomicrospira sp. WB1]|jgi:uncharacterized protein YjeT (DUF2065 family)|uniref:DUF2065 domain-containing protein n=1 Tax=Thiomicrospira sp. WB1 TaxID=1685380 RepID=UPI0007473D68|nr:DUF2065 domain-containing protein [Thiomicrospira sp. WB1]KUJ72238.1 hypothetical protein AVO41_06930 [Thiomicrospira sp. WB1]